jgi:polyisoprenoid-binding protein YceI
LWPTKTSLVAAAILAVTPALSATAQTPAAGPSAPAGISKNPSATVPGVYKLDPNHTSIIARVGHQGGVSLSTFRFAKSEGTLDWNPANPEASKVDVTVDTASIQTPVPDFAGEIAEDRLLNAAKYPKMRFVSTSIRRTGPTTGQITGDLTFNGQTHPLTLQAELVGGGRTGRGQAVIGFSATGSFKRADFGFTAMSGAIGPDVGLIIDAEFNQPNR